jgi:hypothetical protein
MSNHTASRINGKLDSQILQLISCYIALQCFCKHYIINSSLMEKEEEEETLKSVVQCYYTDGQHILKCALKPQASDFKHFLTLFIIQHSCSCKIFQSQSLQPVCQYLTLYSHNPYIQYVSTVHCTVTIPTSSTSVL